MIENELPAIKRRYTNDSAEIRSATCRFENGAQLRVRDARDAVVAVEFFRPDASLTVARLRSEQTTDSPEERLRSMAASYRRCRRRGGRDALERALPELAAVLDVK